MYLHSISVTACQLLFCIICILYGSCGPNQRSPTEDTDAAVQPGVL
jgi:hypothetical protein